MSINADRASDSSQRESPRDDIVATAVVVIVYFAFMLLVGFTPAFLGKPLVHGGQLSIGLAFGVFVTIFLVVAAKVYTARRNRPGPGTSAPGSSK